ncbi:MAG TPA: peptide chain release factor N(5)-glutamine methyltransferase [Xanthobacteraceae bacterium]|nr:peptide chain release factor N(5)-glutamine methyltransferase [Xanthobacteraceae bacterium]
MTRAQLLRTVAARLGTAGIAEPAREARILLRSALGLADIDLIAHLGERVDDGDERHLLALAERRAGGEPMARLTGRREFWSLSFALSPDTLIPRPETEIVVDAALDVLPDRAAALRVLDLGTGSGALLAALLTERPKAFGIGVDRSPGAARQARDNLAALGLARRSAVLVGCWGAALRGGFDLVVSNPPYIRSRDIADLEREVRLHDPLLALDGGTDGLDAYRALAHELPRLLAPDGIAVLELGAGQEADVARLLSGGPLSPLGPARRDLAGIGRALVLRAG